jgi:hypothetical protein
MAIRKNVSKKERIVRIIGGGLMILCGLVGLHATPIGLVIAGAGGISVFTGLIRYCPACAMAGRQSSDEC